MWDQIFYSVQLSTANHSCTMDQFKCPNNRCIPKRWLCDGTDDCGDNEDESNKTCSGSTPVHSSTNNKNTNNNNNNYCNNSEVFPCHGSHCSKMSFGINRDCCFPIRECPRILCPFLFLTLCASCDCYI